MMDLHYFYDNVGYESEQPIADVFLYEVQLNSASVCVNCTFMSSTPTSCLVVVHERISSGGLMNIESSNKLNRSGDTACGCIPTNLNISDRQVAVLVIDGQLIIPPSK